MTVRWFLLLVAVASLLSLGRIWRRLTGSSRRMSHLWIEEDSAKRRRDALVFEGVSHTGKFNR